MERRKKREAEKKEKEKEKKRLLKEKEREEIMNTLTATFIVGSIIGGCFLAWMYTKPGKKWLKDL